MNQNSMAIVILCSYLCADGDIKPFKPAEWANLSATLLYNELQPCDLLYFSNSEFRSKLNFNADETQRINRLIDRSRSVFLEIERYGKIGIHIITRADSYYPKMLKQNLGKSCPPIFYYAGNPVLANKTHIGFVGSRNAAAEDESFTCATVSKINANGFGVVSGGAKGVDSIASATSINNGNFCVEYISDSLIKKIKSKHVMETLLSNRLLILSAIRPDLNFTTGIAMMRNKFIYAHSEATVIVKSDLNKGGTWNGALDNLNKQHCVSFCWNNPRYAGNMELINRGALPIDETWNGDISNNSLAQKELHEQLNLFSF